MSIPFTQFIRSDGRQRQITIDVPAGIEAMAQKLIAHGCRFESEVLRTSEVSILCVDPEAEEEHRVLAWEVVAVANGPEVLEAVVTLVQEASANAEAGGLFGNGED